jgi:GTPase
LALELELGHSDEEAIRKGMVLTEDSHPKAVKEFVVELTMY